MKRREEVSKKQQIISEYLSGNDTYKSLSFKYGVYERTIQTWVRAYRLNNATGAEISMGEGDVKKLKKQLEDAQLKNELLEEMLRLSAEQTGIDVRKKYGTKQS